MNLHIYTYGTRHPGYAPTHGNLMILGVFVCFGCFRPPPNASPPTCQPHKKYPRERNPHARRAIQYNFHTNVTAFPCVTRGGTRAPMSMKRIVSGRVRRSTTGLRKGPHTKRTAHETFEHLKLLPRLLPRMLPPRLLPPRLLPPCLNGQRPEHGSQVCIYTSTHTVWCEDPPLFWVPSLTIKRA